MSGMKAILDGLEEAFGNMEDTQNLAKEVRDEVESLLKLVNEQGDSFEEENVQEMVGLLEQGYKISDHLDQLTEFAEKASEAVVERIEIMKKYSKVVREYCKRLHTVESEDGVLTKEQFESAEKVLEYLEKCERGEADGSREFIMNEDGVIEGIDPGTTH